MSTNLCSSDGQVLHSWKEISSYLGRGVRTVQRYEANLGFPVHRPLGKPRSSVFAFKHEIDQWMAKAPLIAPAAFDGGSTTGSKASLRGAAGPVHVLYTNAADWRSTTASMHLRFVSMRDAVNSMQESVSSMLEGFNKTQTLLSKTKLLWEKTQARRERRANVLTVNEPSTLCRESSAAG